MAFENTMTEDELDPDARNYLDNLRADNFDADPDLAVDGLSESILTRFLGLFGAGRK